MTDFGSRRQQRKARTVPTVLQTCEQYADGLASKKELYRLRKQHPEERMAIANAFESARVTAEYCVNRIWDSIGGDNYHQADHKIYSQEAPAQTDLLREIFGNPFRPVAVDPSWLTSTAVAIAQGIYDDKAFDRLPILADALQDAGCENADILNHLRSPGPHVKGCWALDLVLGKQ